MEGLGTHTPTIPSQDHPALFRSAYGQELFCEGQLKDQDQSNP